MQRAHLLKHVAAFRNAVWYTANVVRIGVGSSSTTSSSETPTWVLCNMFQVTRWLRGIVMYEWLDERRKLESKEEVTPPRFCGKSRADLDATSAAHHFRP
jgi:hypothetical protein